MTPERINCTKCGHAMPNVGFAVCFTCQHGKDASACSKAAREAVERAAKGKR